MPMDDDATFFQAVLYKAKELRSVERQRKRTGSKDAHVPPFSLANLNAAASVTSKEEFDLLIPRSADSKPALEMESFKALNIYMKKYCIVYACSFQNISTFTTLDGLSLSKSISLLLTMPLYNN